MYFNKSIIDPELSKMKFFNEFFFVKFKSDNIYNRNKGLKKSILKQIHREKLFVLSFF